MGLWSRLLRWRQRAAPESAEVGREPTPESGNTVELPTEPFVFECQACGKVFESRRKRAQCPECDSTEIALLSE
jgi:Zn finger protein HypA/HybF involved in hydrogenase expression